MLLLVTLLLLGGALLYLHRDLALIALDDLARYVYTRTGINLPDPIALSEGTLPGEDGSARRDFTADIEALARQITAGLTDDYARLEAIYDWMTHNIAYDLDKLDNMQAYGSGAAYLLQAGKGVCHDYADLTMALLKAAGIEATYESGDVYPKPGEVERHAWNHARVGGIWYALDTTWGAGFVREGEAERRFVQKPRRIYLTTPEELYRLHGDPAYKEEREMAYRRDEAAAAAPQYYPALEQELIALLNRERVNAGLPPFAVEDRVTGPARQSAARIAAAVIRGEDYTLDDLITQLNRKARELRLKSAPLYAFSQWTCPPGTAAELYEHLSAQQQESLQNPALRSAGIGVIRQGDLTVIVQVYIEHY